MHAVDPSNIRHEAGAHRFSVVVDGVEAELGYSRDAHVLSILHTGVPDAIGGRGIAGALVRAAMDFARAEGLKVRPVCEYAEAWMGKHPNYQDLRA
jgi:uncharacterized protein